jgi:thiamine biosynthesis lipoprotein
MTSKTSQSGAGFTKSPPACPLIDWSMNQEPVLKKKTENSTNGTANVAPEAGDGVPERDQPPRDYSGEDPSLLTQVTRRAMATEFVVMLPAHAADAVELAVAALEQLDGIENALTIYRPDSEISRANQMASAEPVELSEETFALLQKAIVWSERTGGAFDITAGPLVEVWGFGRRSGRKPSAAEIDAALKLVGYQNVELSAERKTVRLAQPGMTINLGAIGKGDALDRMAAELRGQGLTDFLIHGGNSSVIAAGDQTSGSGMGWAVGLAHPTKPKRRLAGLWLRDMALATSGSGKQFFHHRGQRFGHVIDPRSGYPAGDMLSLTVLMASAADADACATGMFVNGSAAIGELADEEWLPTMIAVRPGNRQDAVEIECIGDAPWVDDPPEGVSQRVADVD